ncbi:MAG: PAS domain-containing sensor histidine kinase [Candidatus Nealsonbacteria bacterium]|nr:PAS domain-containing sensor histidine kinase [Candidatus Nealsonbacteria bacterium]
MIKKRAGEKTFTERLTEQVLALERKIQERVARILPLVGEDNLKRIIYKETKANLLNGTELVSGVLNFSLAEERFFKLPPAWLRLVIRFLNELIVVLDNIEHENAGKGGVSFIPLPMETERQLAGIGMEDLVQKGEVASLETEIISKSGNLIPVNISASALKDNMGTVKGMVITVKDISEIQRLTIERNRALVASEVLKAKAEFSSIFAHQLRSPLAGIKFALAALLEEGRRFTKDQKKYLDHIQQGLDREIQLVEDLLYSARLETGKLKIEPQATRLDDFIQSIIDEAYKLELAKVKKCRIIFEKSELKLAPIQLDQNIVRQIVYNLIVNAIKYSPDDKCDVYVALKMEGSSFTISIKDSGIGIPEEAQPHIFEKFFRAKNTSKVSAEGTGLGLYITKMLAEALEGEIWFESKEGQGATFYFALPIK